MPTQRKIDLVEELRDRIERCGIAIATEYRGMTVTEMVKLRRAMSEAGVELRVVKNRLFLLAAKAAGKPEMAELAEGPTAIVFGYDDITAPARAIIEYTRTAGDSFAMRNGALDGQILSADELRDLGELPPREVLIGQVVGALQSPVAQFAGLLRILLTNPAGLLLNDSLRTFTGLVEARAGQLEGA